MQYNDDYIPFEIGSAARKREEYKEILEKPKTKGKIKQISKKEVKTKSKASIIFAIACVFGMTILLTYRYNVISEKNLKVQQLKEDLTDVESLLMTTKIEVESNTDYVQIENYAKQQLGMQKPSVNQIVYVDSSSKNNLIESNQQESWISRIFSSIKTKLESLF